MAGCAWCGSKLEVIGNQVGRRDTCAACGHDVHSCRNCRHFDPAVAKSCKEPFAEVPQDKESANFCEFFQVGDGGATTQESLDSARATADALFKKR
jgi:hypothetical protein